MSPIATFSNINSSWEFFQRNLLSRMHRFIPSRLQLAYPSSHPWFTEACGEAVVLKQLAFASWKANPTEGNLSSFHKAQNKCVSTLRRARKQHLSHLKSELSNLSPSSKSWWHLCADDSTLCRTICHPSDRKAAASSLTADLFKITNWSNTWSMTFNPDKSHTLTMSFQKDHLENFSKVLSQQAS